jgi:hypothetical protein
MKKCRKCKLPKSLSEFVKDKNTKDGLSARCRKCRSEDFKKWYTENPEVVKRVRAEGKERRRDYYNSPERKKIYRERYIERTFGIKYEQYDQMLEQQDGKCAICKKPETSSKCSYLSVDHDHKTGKIRGLLCVSCNRGLGMFWDDTLIMEKAINYLKNNR